MANTGDESMATQPALHQMQARLYIAHYICLIIDNHKLYLTKIQHYVTGFDKILDPIYYDYQYIFLYRTYLASLLFNENVTRPQSRTKEVAKQYCVLYRRGRHGEGVSKELLASFMLVYTYFMKNSLIYISKIMHCKIYVLYNTDDMSDLTFYVGMFT